LLGPKVFQEFNSPHRTRVSFLVSRRGKNEER
jgi:hypothetical protein